MYVSGYSPGVSVCCSLALKECDFVSVVLIIQQVGKVPFLEVTVFPLLKAFLESEKQAKIGHSPFTFLKNRGS